MAAEIFFQKSAAASSIYQRRIAYNWDYWTVKRLARAVRALPLLLVNLIGHHGCTWMTLDEDC